MKRERTGYRLTHAVFVDGDGAARMAPKWTCHVRDHRGRARKVSLFTNKAASETAARQLVALVADVQAAGKVTDPAAIAWVAGLPDRIRRRLAEWQIIEPDRAAAGRPLDELLDLWRGALRAKGTSELQAGQQYKRVKRLCELARFGSLVGIDRGRVQSTLAKMRAGEHGKRIGERTSNAHQQALHSFCKWAVRERLLGENPLAGAERVKVTDATKRRALSVDEQRWLIDVTETGPERYSMPGSERATLYALALATGFRAAELGALRCGSFRLDSDPPTAELPAAATKNRRGAVQPLPATIVPRLRTHLHNKLPKAPAFRVPPSYDTAKLFRDDLAAAREAWLSEAKTAKELEERSKSGFLVAETEAGAATFHSLRHSFITNLARAGVAPKQAMDLARHSDINLTLRHYSHTVLAERGTAVDRLPDVTAPIRQRARATGTDHATADPAHWAQYWAQSGVPSRTGLDSGGLSGDNAACSETSANRGKNADSSGKSERSARSSAGQSSGFLSRRS